MHFVKIIPRISLFLLLLLLTTPYYNSSDQNNCCSPSMRTNTSVLLRSKFAFRLHHEYECPIEQYSVLKKNPCNKILCENTSESDMKSKEIKKCMRFIKITSIKNLNQ